MGQGGGQGGGHWFHLLGSLKNLTIGLIWLVTRGGGVGGVGQGGGQGGGDGGSRGVGGEVERVDKMWRPLKGEPAAGVGGLLWLFIFRAVSSRLQESWGHGLSLSMKQFSRCGAELH